MYIHDVSCKVYDENNRELFHTWSPGWAYLRLVEQGLLSGGNVNRKYTLVGDDYVLTVDKDTTMDQINGHSWNRCGIR